MLEVTIFLDEDDMVKDESLYQYIMKYSFIITSRGRRFLQRWEGTV